MPKKKSKPVDPLFFQLFEVSPRKGDLRKIEIIKAAIECIANEGIENLSLETVGKKLKIGRAHVGYYYKTVPEIINMAIKYIMANAQSITVEHVKAAKTPTERIEAMIVAAFEWAYHFPEQASVYMLYFYYCSKDPSHREVHRQIRQVGASRLETILVQAANERPGSRKQSYQSLAKDIQFRITGGVVEAITTSSQAKRKEDFEHWQKLTLTEIKRYLSYFLR